MLLNPHDIRLNKDIPIPLYYQFKKQMLELIENSKLKQGDMIPPESELCTMLNVSRPTVRQALNELVTEGYLLRYKGRGTFVAAPKITDRFFSTLETFDQEMHSKGMNPRTEVLSLEKITDFSRTSEKLMLDPQAPLIHLSRLRYVDDTVLVYVETFLPFAKYSDLMDVDFSKNSLYESLERIYNVRVSHARRDIEAVNAQSKEAKLLMIAQGEAIFLVRTLTFSKESPEPVEFSVARYRGDMNKFSVEISR